MVMKNQRKVKTEEAMAGGASPKKSEHIPGGLTPHENESM
jgi:hypothetical protein